MIIWGVCHKVLPGHPARHRASPACTLPSLPYTHKQSLRRATFHTPSRRRFHCQAWDQPHRSTSEHTSMSMEHHTAPTALSSTAAPSPEGVHEHGARGACRRNPGRPRAQEEQRQQALKWALGFKKKTHTQHPESHTQRELILSAQLSGVTGTSCTAPCSHQPVTSTLERESPAAHTPHNLLQKKKTSPAVESQLNSNHEPWRPNATHGLAVLVCSGVGTSAHVRQVSVTVPRCGNPTLLLTYKYNAHSHKLTPVLISCT